MNSIEKEILKDIYINSYVSQKDLAEKLSYSVGSINKAMKGLQDKKLIEDNKLTSKAKKILKANKVKNAIILAAGYGIRMVPINLSQPKGLIEIKGERIIERLIKQLHEVGVEDISLVVGYQKEKFDYLVDKYGVTLHINMDYHFKNNLHSLNRVNDKIDHTYILPSDLYFEENPFSPVELYSWYMLSDNKKSSSYIRENRQRKIVLAQAGQETNNMIGLSFISKEDSAMARDKISRHSKDSSFDNYFWEDALIKSGFQFYSKHVDQSAYYEINTYEQLMDLDPKSKQLESKIIDEIKGVFNVEADQIKDIKTLKKGMTNRSFLFSVEGNKYIMRIPGEGTDAFINRYQEAEVYNIIKDLGICDDIIHINPDHGYKITKYVENARVVDVENSVEVIKAFNLLKELHKAKLSVGHRFELFETIRYYKGLYTAESLYEDYYETEANVMKLEAFINKNKNDDILCHIDANGDNYLLYEENGQEQIRLIDWEYAAMQDPALDIAMFNIYSMLDRKASDEVIDIYYEGKATKMDRALVYAYMAISGLMWSNWCEIKSQLGVEFGEYSIAQYRYAKDYYKILKQEGFVD